MTIVYHDVYILQIKNKFEINLFLEYNKSLDDKHPLKYKDDTDKSVLLGSKNIKNKIFDLDCANVDTGNLIETPDHLRSYYQHLHNQD